MRRAPFYVPALLRFPGSSARQDGWGRLISLSAGGAELSTAAPLARGEAVSVHFELGGERLRAAALVHHCELDADGHRLAELRWADEVERRRLARLLVDVLARS